MDRNGPAAVIGIPQKALRRVSGTVAGQQQQKNPD